MVLNLPAFRGIPASLSIQSGGGGEDLPIITSLNAVTLAENTTLAHTLTANEAVTWSLNGGPDVAQFELSGSTLRWTSNGVRDHENPADADDNNAYKVVVRATNASLAVRDQIIIVTVTDANESPITPPVLSFTSDPGANPTTIDVTQPDNTAEVGYYLIRQIAEDVTFTTGLLEEENQLDNEEYVTASLAFGIMNQLAVETTYYYRDRWRRGEAADPNAVYSDWSNIISDTTGSDIAQFTATLDPDQKSSFASLSNGNMTLTGHPTLNSWAGSRSTQYRSSGKFYFEVYSAGLIDNRYAGVCNESVVFISGFNFPGYNSTNGISTYDGFYYYYNSSLPIEYGSQWWGADSTLMVAFDTTLSKVWFGVNGTWSGSGTQNPATGQGGISVPLDKYYPHVAADKNDVLTVNFGATAFAHTPPAGFLPFNG